MASSSCFNGKEFLKSKRYTT